MNNINSFKQMEFGKANDMYIEVKNVSDEDRNKIDNILDKEGYQSKSFDNYTDMVGWKTAHVAIADNYVPGNTNTSDIFNVLNKISNEMQEEVFSKAKEDKEYSKLEESVDYSISGFGISKELSESVYDCFLNPLDNIIVSPEAKSKIDELDSIIEKERTEECNEHNRKINKLLDSVE